MENMVIQNRDKMKESKNELLNNIAHLINDFSKEQSKFIESSASTWYNQFREIRLKNAEVNKEQLLSIRRAAIDIHNIKEKTDAFSLNASSIDCGVAVVLCILNFLSSLF